MSHRNYPLGGLTITTKGPLVVSLNVEAFLAWCGLPSSPENRADAVREVIDALTDMAWSVSVTLPDEALATEGGD